MTSNEIEKNVQAIVSHGYAHCGENEQVLLSYFLNIIRDTAFHPLVRKGIIAEAKGISRNNMRLVDDLIGISYEPHDAEFDKTAHTSLRVESINGLVLPGDTVSFSALYGHLESDIPSIVGSSLKVLVQRGELFHAYELLSSQKKQLESDVLQFSLRKPAGRGQLVGAARVLGQNSKEMQAIARLKSIHAAHSVVSKLVNSHPDGRLIFPNAK